MDDTEKRALRAEILEEVGEMLRERFAGDEWGRALVEVVRGDDGEPLVAGIDVEEIVGDEARVDAAFADDSARPLLPVLAKATEALCEMEGVELDDVRGGTFLRQRGGGLGWLAGLVHLPSNALEASWDAVVADLERRNAALEERFSIGHYERYDVDVEKQTIVFSSGGQPRVVARATLIGTWAKGSRTFGWGGSNRHLPEAVRKVSAELIDGILERDMCELSTPVFATDEATSWALAALVCQKAGGDGVYRSPYEGGVVFLLLREVQAT